MEQPVKKLEPYIEDRIWIKEYPINYSGAKFYSRMTVIRLSDEKLLIHSPCHIDSETKSEIDALGQTAHIVAPGNFHYLHVPSCQEAYPDAAVYLCPGIELKMPEIEFDWFLGDKAPQAWEADLEQCLIRGNKLMWEVAFYHRACKTLILVDVVENFTDDTPGTNLYLRISFKLFRMWNRPRPAPEYRMSWKHKAAARKSMEKILSWDFERVILSHGDLIEENAKETVRDSWRKLINN